ncbi:MAG TPA: SDR family NAD(P)-dependent oxidoreductase [Bacteroidales bacterium]|jgi:NAD(P)-dependent dehydrogenase (short-subunit alcohol dehydrogenase family)|nr:SDR family NAD(P)-dependent oxidoreductase [Bacteroidales bacterium]HNR42111.1 SDR family NAD(P)-dependent oxidoreductase [Bacteroidales bacterium]
MQVSETEQPTVFITGGTSGLGIELTRLYLDRGCRVINTGRRPVHPLAPRRNLEYYPADFSDLERTSRAARIVCEAGMPDIVINNAGILSPARHLYSKNGLEYTFQVNFLAHLLINEIILRRNPRGHPLTTVAITSVAYRNGTRDLILPSDPEKYRPFKAYSDSKLYLTIMSRHLHERYSDPWLRFISFNPGVFRSGIYRMQKKWFGTLYSVAAPFMRTPAGVAGKLAGIIGREELVNGSVCNYRNGTDPAPETDKTAEKRFWLECYGLIEPFLDAG